MLKNRSLAWVLFFVVIMPALGFSADLELHRMEPGVWRESPVAVYVSTFKNLDASKNGVYQIEIIGFTLLIKKNFEQSSLTNSLKKENIPKFVSQIVYEILRDSLEGKMDNRKDLNFAVKLSDGKSIFEGDLYMAPPKLLPACIKNEIDEQFKTYPELRQKKEIVDDLIKEENSRLEAVIEKQERDLAFIDKVNCCLLSVCAASGVYLYITNK